MPNSIDPDERAHMSPLIWIYTVCKNLENKVKITIIACGNERIKLNLFYFDYTEAPQTYRHILKGVSIVFHGHA